MKSVIPLAYVLFAICQQLCTGYPLEWEKLPPVQQSNQEYFHSNEADRTELSNPFAGPNFLQDSTETSLQTLALHTGPQINKSVNLIRFEEDMVVDWEYITPQPTGFTPRVAQYDKARVTLAFIHRNGPGLEGREKIFLNIAVRPNEDTLLLNTAVRGKWGTPELPKGFPIVPGMRVVLRVEALADRFRISVPYGSQFTYDFMYRRKVGSVWDTNEIFVEARKTAETTQRVVVSKKCAN